MSSQAVTASEDRDYLVSGLKDGSLGFVGDVLSFKGEVHFKSMLRIDGKFSGQINSPGGTLIVSAGAHVTGAMINVAVAKINGTVEGQINASELLELGRTANVVGELIVGKLVVEESALFDGICRKIHPSLNP
ncbi:MAG: polymer-forming cytoskeletal protein [Acidobacteriota bacterium]|nr:polymer-forming cytoskeletal protein [Acidobacteriota bacterium]